MRLLQDSRRLLFYGLSVTCIALALMTLVRVSALQVEARVDETWYSYRQWIDYDFTARVEPGLIYNQREIPGGKLYRLRLPVEPAAYRRVLVTSQTESVILTFSFVFEGDRPAELSAIYGAEATMTVQNLWHRPLPSPGVKEKSVTGQQLTIEQFQYEIPIREIVQEMEQITEELRMNQDQIEVRVRPFVKMTVDGLREPIMTGLSPEVVVLIRGLKTGTEVDEARTISDGNSHGTTQVTPLTVTLFGYVLRLSVLRQALISLLVILTGSLALFLAVRWLKQKAQAGNHLKRLGTSLIEARGFEIPTDVTLIQVSTDNQLLSLHLQTDRPVIRVGDICYLLDGKTCYWLTLTGEGTPPAPRNGAVTQVAVAKQSGETEQE